MIGLQRDEEAAGHSRPLDAPVFGLMFGIAKANLDGVRHCADSH